MATKLERGLSGRATKKNYFFAAFLIIFKRALFVLVFSRTVKKRTGPTIENPTKKKKPNPIPTW